jgi:phage terminase small subunit
MRGRKPKPTFLKVLDGNPRKRLLNDREPQAAAGIPDRPDWLDAEAQAKWDGVTRELADMGLLALADRAPLTAYCRWVDAEPMVKKFGAIVKSPEKGFPM